MELYQLEELAALAEYGSISKAAESVGVSQPAMSRSMKLLEADIGVPIFQRTSNTIELNDTGRLAASKAAEITAAVRKATEEIREFDRDKGVRQKEEDNPCRLRCPCAALECHLDAFFL